MQGEITANGLIIGGMIGQRGAPGNGIASIEKTGESGLIDTYTITYTNGTTDTIQVTNGAKGDKGDKGDQGIQGIQGVKGDKGDKGDTGEQGMQGIQGERGEKGEQGERGERGYQGVTGEKGEKGDKGDTGAKGDTGETGNGISSIEKTSTSGNVDTYTITFTDGTTTTFEVTNGEDGDVQDVQIEGTSIVDNHVANITGLATQKELDLYKTIYNALPKITGTGESLTLNETAKSVMKNKLYPSEMSQEGTPSPEYPQTIHTITGDNTIEVAGKNLYNQTDLLNVQGWTKSNDYYTGGTYDLRIYWKNTKPIYSSFKENTQYTFSWTGYLGTATNVRIKFIYTDGTNTDNMAKLTSSEANVYGTSTLNKTIDHIEVDYGTSGTIFIKDIQLEESSTASTYEPYQSQSKPLNLGELEYNAIGDYKDEFVKVDGKWFLRKNIQKVIFDGTENWQSYNDYVYMETNFERGIGNIGYCDKVVPFSTSNLQYTSTAKTGIQAKNLVSYWGLSDTTITTWKNYLANNNLILCYPLATPQDILLNDTLQEQIEDMYNQTLSYEGQTNISQVNNDLAFIVESSALRVIE